MKLALSPRLVFFEVSFSACFFTKVRRHHATVMRKRMQKRYAAIEDSAAVGRDISALNVQKRWYSAPDTLIESSYSGKC